MKPWATALAALIVALAAVEARAQRGQCAGGGSATRMSESANPLTTSVGTELASRFVQQAQLQELARRHDPKVSRATVYRTLAVLEEQGFVEGLDTGDGGRRFEHVLGHEHHDHMVCLGCGTIIEFRDEELERRQLAAAKRVGFRIESHSLRMYGRCRSCQRSGKGG